MVVLQNITPCFSSIISTTLALFPGRKFLNKILPNSVFKNFVLKISFIPNGIPKKTSFFLKSMFFNCLLIYLMSVAILNLYFEFNLLNFLKKRT